MSVDGREVSQSEFEFRDGGDCYELSVSPAALPMRYLYGQLSNDFVTWVVLGAAVYASHLVDRRWKVTVGRRRDRAFSVWRTIDVAFFDTVEEAEAHQLHLLRTWDSGPLAGNGRVGALEMSRRRRTSKAAGRR